MSEFGKGIVVCIVKFSEHLNNDLMCRVRSLSYWLNSSSSKQAELLSQAKAYPNGDVANLVRDASIYGGLPDEKLLSQYIESWANGASDHFYDLDREKAPKALCELATLTLDMGHGFRREALWTSKDIETIYRLWEEASLELDLMLGVRDGDWGEW